MMRVSGWLSIFYRGHFFGHFAGKSEQTQTMKLSPDADVLIMGHPLLFKEQPQVSLDDIATPEFQENLNTLQQIQLRSNGIGIAAPQAGWATRVLCLGISEDNQARYPQAPDIPFSYWINAQVVASSQDTCWSWEGCLSVPGIRAWIERPASITVVGYDQKGDRKHEELSGFHARVMQHELDHLNGILFPSRVEDKGLMIPSEAALHQDKWVENWPTENARKTPGGVISKER